MSRASNYGGFKRRFWKIFLTCYAYFYSLRHYDDFRPGMHIYVGDLVCRVTEKLDKDVFSVEYVNHDVNGDDILKFDIRRGQEGVRHILSKRELFKKHRRDFFDWYTEKGLIKIDAADLASGTKFEKVWEY